MAELAAPPQERESRTEKVAIAVTPSEKAAVRAVAAVNRTDESNLCRTRTIEEIVREFEGYGPREER
jgi:hypothetical protein